MYLLRIFDLEISGMRAYDEVIDFAIIDVDIDRTGLVVDEKIIFNSLINGAQTVSEQHSQLTGICTSDILAPSLPTIDKIPLFDTERIICSYGLQFDLSWYRHSMVMNGHNTEVITQNGFCLLEESKRLFGYKVSLSKLLGLPRTRVHRSLGDALMLRDALVQHIKKGEKIKPQMYKGQCPIDNDL